MSFTDKQWASIVPLLPPASPQWARPALAAGSPRARSGAVAPPDRFLLVRSARPLSATRHLFSALPILVARRFLSALGRAPRPALASLGLAATSHGSGARP